MRDVRRQGREEVCAKKRVIVIAGRPNVGKSAIFNRLTRARVAIVHEESGVTRDRLMREASWGDERFDLVDTGGIGIFEGERTADRILAEIGRQVDAALEDAAAVVLVVDVQAGRTPMDEAVAARLRRLNVPTFVAANKADHDGLEAEAAAFHRLGFPVFPVSALHRRGFDELMPAVIRELPPPENETEVTPLRVAVVGRPNVGKSSYINRLLRSDRVIVSDQPGTTRDSVEVPFSIGRGDQARHYRLLDTAGMRRRGRVDTAVEKYGLLRAEESVKTADVAVLVIDALQGPTQQDKKIASLVVSHERGCVVLVNKWDLARGEVGREDYAAAMEEAMPFMAYCPLVFASAKSGFNIRASVQAVDLVASQVRATLPTGVLNRVLRTAVLRTSAPARRGQRFKLFYATQVGRAPIRVKVFVNEPQCVTPAYRAYLIRSLRESFGLEGAPVILSFSRRRAGREG